MLIWSLPMPIIMQDTGFSLLEVMWCGVVHLTSWKFAHQLVASLSDIVDNAQNSTLKINRSWIIILDTPLLDALKANFLYSEDVNKNSPKLFVLPYLNVFLIYQYHYLPKKKINWAKKQSFDDVTFAMTLFWAKKLQKLSLLGEEKISKPKNCLKSSLIMCFN